MRSTLRLLRYADIPLPVGFLVFALEGSVVWCATEALAVNGAAAPLSSHSLGIHEDCSFTTRRTSYTFRTRNMTWQHKPSDRKTRHDKTDLILDVGKGTTTLVQANMHQTQSICR